MRHARAAPLAAALALLPLAAAQNAYGAGLVWVYDEVTLADDSGTAHGLACGRRCIGAPSPRHAAAIAVRTRRAALQLRLRCAQPRPGRGGVLGRRRTGHAQTAASEPPRLLCATCVRAGYSYVMGERPSYNVPWVAMAAENVGGNACKQTASFTNVSCVMPPENVTVTWRIQAIASVRDIEQQMTLNSFITVDWNDWRLKYAEGGVGCWSWSTQLGVPAGVAAAASATAVQTQLLAALRPLWGCSGSSCTDLPLGVVPTATVVVDATGASLDVTVFPAPPRLGFADPNNMNGKIDAALGTVAAANPGGALRGAPTADWTWNQELCVGADARRLPEAMPIYSGGASTSNAGSGSPATVDAITIWTPEFTDSLNQAGPEEAITNYMYISSNGDVRTLTHAVAAYGISMRLAAYPFDKPYFVATRRSGGMSSQAVRVSIADVDFASPQNLEGWKVLGIGSMVCNMRADDAASDATPCDASMQDSPLCEDVVVVWFQLQRRANYFLSNFLGPIFLVTTMAAAGYYNDLDQYELRATIMATSLLSQMALQAYVSSALPESESVTFLHYALYTSYTLMGFGVFFVVTVSYGLSTDFAAARKVGRDGKPSPAYTRRISMSSGGGGGGMMSRLRMMRVGTEGVQHWRMRIYYNEALQFRRLLKGNVSDDEEIPELLYFPGAAAYISSQRAGSPKEAHARSSSRMTTSFRDAEANNRADKSSLESWADAHEEMPSADDAHDGGYGLQRITPDPVEWPYCPKFIWLRRFLVEFDLFMRFGHLFIFCFVLLVRYCMIANMEDETVSCSNLADFYGEPS
jgi:hypothetical protein